MRIAFFGGTFDPPHCGHLAIAQAAIERLGVDQVWMGPAGVQPLKRGMAHTAFEDRLRMVQLACTGQEYMAATAIDAPRIDGRPNYTYDTLLKLRRSRLPGDEVFLLMGADSWSTLRKWHRAAGVLGLCRVVVAGRPGASLDEAGAALPDGVSCVEVGRRPGLVEYALHGCEAEGARLYVMPDLQYDVSATAIREALASGEAAVAERFVDPRVAEYVWAHGLYKAG